MEENGFAPKSPEGTQLCRHLDFETGFGLLASRTVRCVCAVVSHEVWSDALQQRLETNNAGTR